MELACALVFLIVGSVTAGPHGYGTKGGVAAKADARAVAGAYTGAGSVPLSIPSGASYSGSFSQASSSSSSSSSASSNSFSYSGSGAIDGVLGGKRCDSGNCNTGGATGSQGSAAAGSQAYSGGNAGSLAGGYGGKIAVGSYGHKSGNDKGQDCGSESCQGTSDLSSSNAGIGSQSNSDAKVAASAGGGYTVGSNCGGSDCNNAPGADNMCVSGQCGSKAKCSSGDCGTASHVGGTTSHYDDSNECSSGQCGLNQNTDGSSSIDSETDDINVHTTGSANAKSNYGSNKPGCPGGNCASSPASGSLPTSGYNKPALDLTAPKLEPSCSGSNCQISTYGYISSSPTKAPYFSTSYQNENQFGHVSSGYESLSKPSYGHGSSLGYSSVKTPGEASCAPGSPGCGSSAPGYDSSSSGKPSYSHPACVPGTPGCIPTSSPSAPSDCASGLCGTHLSVPSVVGTKPSYAYGSSPSSSSVNPLGSACAPGTLGCSTSSDCESGNCGAYPSGYVSSMGIKPSNYHESSPSYSSVNPVSSPCTPGSPGCATSTSPIGPSGCASGSCGGYPTSTGYSDFSNKPTYSQGSSPSYSSGNPSSLACTPGSPGCATPTSPIGPLGCASGNCGGSPSLTGYSDFSNKPSYSHSGSPSYFPSKPSGLGCTPGTPGCGLAPATTTGCASGKCSGNPTGSGYDSSFNVKPSYSHGNSPSYTPVKPVGLPCTPGTPECSTVQPSSGPFDCISGNCGVHPSAPGYAGSSNIKPNYSQGLPSFSTLVPLDPACAPGSPGCALSPAASGPSGCASGNCGTYPTSAGSSTGIKSSYSYGSISAHAQIKPSGPACVPGTPGCALPSAPSGPSSCTSGNCDEFPPIGGQGGFPSIKPSYSQGSSSYYPVKPSGSVCTPGAPGCAITSSLSSSSGCASGNCGTNLSPQGCAPGTPGCSGSGIYSGASGFPSGHPTAGTSFPVSGSPSYGTSSLPSGQANTGISAPTYGASDVGSSSHQAAYGTHGTGSLQTSFNKPPTGVQAGISGSGAYTPGIGSSPQLGIVGVAAGASGQHGAKENLPAYTGGFGGPAGILKPNEYNAALSSSYGNKPTVSTGPTTVKPSCVSGICDAHASPSLGISGSGAYTPGIGSSPQLGIVGVAAGASGQHGAKENLPAYTGGFGGPAGVLKPNEYNAALSSSYGNKPTVSTGPTTAKPSCVSGICDAHASPSLGISGSGAYTPGIGSSAQLGIVSAAAGASGQHGAKENLPAYTGGFGGPSGILKPNENSAAASLSYGNKPTVSTGPTTVKPSCVSGVCDAHASPSFDHTGTASGAHATAGASASADAVAYTGGFGGPPGLLKPYDNGKADIKSATGLTTSLDFNQGSGGSGYLNVGSQVSGSAIAQANAAAVSSAGASSGDYKPHSGNNGGYSHGHGHGGAGGCGGGCGGSGSLGYSGSLGLSKTGILEDSGNGLAAAGAVAKSVANASSGARAYGGSYSSSSATAHAGASVKGGYGRR